MERRKAWRTGSPAAALRRTRRWPSPAHRLGLCGAAAALLPLSLAGSASAAAPPTGDAGASIATAPAGAVAGSVDAGAFHTCGVKTNGTLACWGANVRARPPRPRAPSPR